MFFKANILSAYMLLEYVGGKSSKLSLLNRKVIEI